MEKSIKKINSIRYMGNKAKLLEYIIPEIESITKYGDTICDIMAGTNSVGYALSERNKIISNDVQYYSYVIGKALLCCKKMLSDDDIKQIKRNIEVNFVEKKYKFFVLNYSDTYFSKKQCGEIDDIRYAISKVKNEGKRCQLLLALMHSMCRSQSTTGHFAQFLDKKHYRVQNIRKLSIVNIFYEKVVELTSIKKPLFQNKIYNVDYNDLLKKINKTKVECFYLDPPYTHDQYSRFYHLLETVCKYDSPVLTNKAKYRTDRFMSGFCYSDSVLDEFDKIISFCAYKHSKLVISYSNRGVAKVVDIISIAKKYYKKVEYKKVKYKHSSQGKGTVNLNEVIIICI